MADLQQDGLLDIVYTNRISGEVGVLENLGGGSFGSPVLYQAGPGPYGVTGTADPSPVTSLEGTTSVAAGHSRRAVSPRWSRSTRARTPSACSRAWATASSPTRRSFDAGVRLGGTCGRFRRQWPERAGRPHPDGLFIYVANGQGGFLPPTEYNVGFEPNGLTVADLNGDGKADLLVSNPLGDVQVLIGNGNGTFQPVQNLDQQVGLAV